MQHFRTETGELVKVDDPDVAAALEQRYQPVTDRAAAAAGRAGEPIIDWAVTVANLAALAAIRGAQAWAPGALYVRSGAVGTVEAVDALSDRALIEAIESVVPPEAIEDARDLAGGGP